MIYGFAFVEESAFGPLHCVALYDDIVCGKYFS